MKRIDELLKAKTDAEKIIMLTCYDYWSAKILAESKVDLLLVGDSVSMVMHGYDSTLPATMVMMELHTSAVARGCGSSKLIVTDFPFLEFRKSLDQILESARALMVSGANALKVEGADGNLEKIKYLVESGVPVFGHLGLTPQMVNTLSGYKVQGKTKEAFEKIKRDAKALEEAGCCGIVLECVPESLAASVSKALKIPVIGIGAGSFVDGQVLVLHDLLGANSSFQPKFVRKYENIEATISSAIDEFVSDVKSKSFPSERESFL